MKLIFPRERLSQQTANRLVNQDFQRSDSDKSKNHAKDGKEFAI